MPQQSKDIDVEATTIPVPPGTWTLDPTAGRIGFGASGMWGLLPVRGVFERARGTLVVAPDSVTIEFSIDASSLNTKNDKRDTHLRGPDFFDVDRYPEIAFDPIDVVAGATGVTIIGDLLIRDRRVGVELLVEISEESDRLVLRTQTSVSRKAAGLDWSRLGMIRGDVDIDLELALVLEP